ncbi:MAG: Chorismate lyase [Pseudomonadota bacterium]
MWTKRSFQNLKIISSKNSLTKHLSRFGALEIKLISSRIKRISKPEREIYGQSGLNNNFYVRDVLIGFADKPLIYARTITKIQKSKKLIYMLKKLSSKSLGNMLFNNHYSRSDFEYSKPKNIRFLKKLFITHDHHINDIKIVRRSFFNLKQDKILLFEAFFNEIDNYDYE